MEGVRSSASPPLRTPEAARAPSDTTCAVTASLAKVWMDGRTDRWIYEWMDRWMIILTLLVL